MDSTTLFLLEKYNFRKKIILILVLIFGTAISPPFFKSFFFSKIQGGEQMSDSPAPASTQAVS
jgi:hypothetical protein